MHVRIPRHGPPAIVVLALAGMLLVGASGADGAALTTASPEVQSAVDRGVKFLESGAAKDDRLGAAALVGLALLKHHGRPDHPKIVDAAAKIQKALGNRDPAKLNLNAWDVYSTGLSIVFLVELDPVKHRADVECLLKYLHWRQKPHGGWGYPNLTSGDTSMTQYGVLGAWEAVQAGFAVPTESIEAVTVWLLKTQDPSGGFGYQGVVSDNFTPVPQSNVKHGLTAAGLGSVYICGALLGIEAKPEKPGKGDLPPALKEIKPKNEKDAVKPRSRIDPRLVWEVQSRGAHWLQENYKIDPPGFTHYYLYALERCMSFQEFYERKVEKEPTWYDDGARYLIKTQQRNGSWRSQSGAVPDTAFAMLFLLRSMKRSLEKIYTYGDGTMIGGRGLPRDTSKVELRGGRVVARPLLGPAEKLLAALDDPQKIRRLVGDKSPPARLAAVRVLGKTRDLDNVETLIYALTDPDTAVVRAANEALLRISRSPSMIAIADNFTDEDRRLLIEKWKVWYRAIRPDATPE